MSVRKKIIVALDVVTYEEAARLVDVLSEVVDIFKVGIAPFTSYGERIMEKISSHGKKIFLDLKVHDIPNTVRSAAKNAAEKEVFMMNFHCMGGYDMLKAAREGADSAKTSSGRKPILLGVTVLTSMDEASFRKIGFTGDVEEKVLEFAELAKEAGLDGVVSSAREVKKIKEVFGKEFLTVTPGIRPGGVSRGDQKRTMTPREAFDSGSDYIVVGRPVIEAADPVRAVMDIAEETGAPA